MRTDIGGTDGGGGDAAGGGTSEGTSGDFQDPEEDIDRVGRAMDSKDCFMKYASRNLHPGECSSDKNEALIPLVDILSNSADYSDMAVDGAGAEEMGWALRTKRRGGAFDPAVRKYLTEAFEEGESTGRKLDPQTIAKSMRQLFPKEQWLKPAQIASFWSRLARLRRQEPLSDLAVDDDDNTDQATLGNEEDIQDDPYFNNIEADLHDSINENIDNIFERAQSL